MKMNTKFNLLIISLFYFCSSVVIAKQDAIIQLTNDQTNNIQVEDEQDRSIEEGETEQEEEKSRWFEVELIVFKPNNEKAMNDESWDENLEFTQSDKLIDFLQPYYLENVITSQLDPNQLDPNQLDPNQATNLIDIEKTEQAESTLTDASLINSSIVDINSLDEEAKLLSKFNQPIQEKPFTLLTSDLLKLNNETASLNRHPDYKVLTHIGWRQPMVGKNESNNIRIAGGEDHSEFFAFNGSKLSNEITEDSEANIESKLELETNDIQINSTDTTNPMLARITDINPVDLEEELLPVVPKIIPMIWVPELDGDIKIYLNRYLHIQTNLFLRKPAKEIIDAIDLNIYNPELLSSFSIENNQNSLIENGLIQNKTLLNSDPTQNLLSTSVANKPSHQFSWEISDSFLNEASEKMYIERLFNYSIKQSRRVRSGELHYFDHPLMGIIILITPYELPSLPIGNLNETTSSKNK